MVRRLHPIMCLTLAMALAHVVGSRESLAQSPAPPPMKPPVEALSIPTDPPPLNAAPLAEVPPEPVPPKVEPKALPQVGGRRTKTPTLDAQAVPTAGSPEPDGEKNPLPLAEPKPGSPVVAPAGETRMVDRLEIPADQLPSGPQTVSLSVSIVAPEVMNVNHTSSIKIYVKNTGVADARAVRVHYDLPPELELDVAQPEAKQLPGERRLNWVLDTVSAGNEQMLLIKVKALKASTVDHAALVTLVTGSRSRTVIQEPMLKVETTVTPSKLLIGQQARFNITITNPGSGPARNVVVRATLSSGLKADGEEIVEQTIPIIYPDRPVTLDSLVVDTIGGGEQTCTVTALSTDVKTVDDDKRAKDQKKICSLIVLRPELKLELTGPETRYTDTYADYTVTVSNPGTATAKDVRVTLALPANSGKLQKPLPPGSEWNSAKQTLTITFPKIDPKTDSPGKQTAKFTVLLGGPGMYRISADARSGSLHDKAGISTDVSGMADLELNITEKRRVLDVGETTIFYIKIKNVGTKPAKNIVVRTVLSKNIEVSDTAGTEAEASIDKVTGDLLFPMIDSLPQGKTLDLSIRVKALKPGVAQARVLLKHDDLPDAAASIEDVANTRITGAAPDSVRK